jgi:2-dehydro-3-deoxyphosphogluconate aldolase/(4S)-4-hydroxy-2-oxoglutarate aldolase
MQNLSTLPLVGIIRGAGPDSISQVCRAAVEGGLRTLEITLNSPEPFAQIKAARAILEETIDLGAGTVLTVEEAKKAIDAGARFIVTPTIIPGVIRFCVDNQIPVIPGAMTPTECFTAHVAGATMVKVFPASVLGPDYFRLLHGPFPEIRLLPTGGINLENVADYLNAGARAVGVSSELFRKEWILDGDWESLKQEASRFVKAVTELQ